MTKEEAKNKFCPLTFIGVTSLMSGSLGPTKANEAATTIRKASACINDECMMWRTQAHTDGGGVCGLAGKP